LKQVVTGVPGRIAAAVLGLWMLAAQSAAPGLDDGETLAPEPRHEKIGQLVTEFVQKSHYRHADVDDALSAKVLDRYLESLDGNRLYLLQSDVDAFSQYRHKLDDMVRAEPLTPVFLPVTSKRLV